MGLFDGFFSGIANPRRDRLPTGVTVKHLRTAYRNKLLEHFATAFPGRETFIWDDPDTYIELAVMAPTAAEPYYVVHTIGMSADPMNLDDLPPKQQYDWLRTAELMAFLPGGWPVDAENWPEHLADPENRAAAWPLLLLRSLAALPRRGNTWLGAGHSIPNGSPAHPYGGGSHFTGAVLFLTGEGNGPKPVENIKLEGGKRLMLYIVTPVYPQEMEFKIAFGAEELERRLRALPGGAGFMVDESRPCTVSGEDLARARGAQDEDADEDVDEDDGE